MQLVMTRHSLHHEMDSTIDPSGDLSASESAEETASPKSEEQQDGRFSFAELYTYITDGRYPSSFVKVDKQALRKRAKLFMVKGTQLYYIGGGGYYNNSNAAVYMLIAYNIMQLHYYYCYSYATWHHGL